MTSPLSSTSTSNQNAELWVIGLNHRTAPVEMRERFHLDEPRTLATLKALLHRSLCDEALVLSTCNRVEIYGITSADQDALPVIAAFLAEKENLPLESLMPHLYHHRGLNAVHHGFRVTSSLDSLVLGEPQISGQVKDAYRLATEADSLGFYLSKYFNRAFFVAKKVRSETRVGAGAVSVGYAACELGRQIFGNLDDKHALVMGTGEMGERIIEHLVTQKVGKLWLANRTQEKAHDLQTRFGGEVIALSDCLHKLDTVDIVMSSLSVETPYWTHTDLRAALSNRNRPLFMIDVSVPRSLDPKLSEIDSVYLYNIDDLEQAIARNQEDRLEEAQKAELIVETEAQTYFQDIHADQVSPTISSLFQKFHDIKQQELAKTLRKYPHLSAEAVEAFNRCADAIVNKILHLPIHELKTQQAQETKEGSKVKHFIETLSALFHLD